MTATCVQRTEHLQSLECRHAGDYVSLGCIEITNFSRNVAHYHFTFPCLFANGAQLSQEGGYGLLGCRSIECSGVGLGIVMLLIELTNEILYACIGLLCICP